jgi:hypothetical protein
MGRSFEQDLADKHAGLRVEECVEKLCDTVRTRIINFQKFMDNAQSNEEDTPAYVHILEIVPARELASAFCLPEVRYITTACTFLYSI